MVMFPGCGPAESAHIGAARCAGGAREQACGVGGREHSTVEGELGAIVHRDDGPLQLPLLDLCCGQDIHTSQLDLEVRPALDDLLVRRVTYSIEPDPSSPTEILPVVRPPS
jgi:hypothetical protein